VISPRLLFQGDPTECIRWVGLAKKLARQAYAAGVISRVWTVAEGVTIRVDNVLQGHSGVCKVWIKSLLKPYHFIFYPRKVTLGNGGIYTSSPSLFQYPNEFISNIENLSYYTRFSFIRYRKADKVQLAKGDLALLSGNQFFFARGSVYSWWGSMCGDGPEEKVSVPAKFNFPARYIWKNSAPNIIYKDGDTWVNLKSSLYFVEPYEDLFYKIAGIFVGAVSVGESRQSRLVVATYLMNEPESSCDLLIHVFKKHTDSRWIEVGQHSVDGLYTSLLWPMRFTSDGHKGSIIYKKLRIDEGVPIFSFTLATFTFSYGDDSTSFSVSTVVTDEPYLNEVEHSTIERDFNVSFSETPHDANLNNFTQTINATLHLLHEVEQTFVPTSAKLPIALNYDHEDQLKVIYAKIQYTGYYGDHSFYNESAESTMTGLCWILTKQIFSMDSFSSSSTWDKGSSYDYQCTLQLLNQADEIFFESILATDTENSSGSGDQTSISGNTYSRVYSERQLWFYYLDALTQSYFYESVGASGELTESSNAFIKTHNINLKILDTLVYDRNLTADLGENSAVYTAGGFYADNAGNELNVTNYYGSDVSESTNDTTSNPILSPNLDFTTELLFTSMNVQTEIEYSVVIDHRIKMVSEKTPAWAYSFYMNYTNPTIGADFDGVLSRFEYVFNDDGFMSDFVPHVLCQGQSSFGELHLYTPTVVGGVQVSESYEPWSELVHHPIGLF
jgi:hypothetical protein